MVAETVGRLGALKLGVGERAMQIEALRLDPERTLRQKYCVPEDSPWELVVVIAFGFDDL